MGKGKNLDFQYMDKTLLLGYSVAHLQVHFFSALVFTLEMITFKTLLEPKINNIY